MIQRNISARDGVPIEGVGYPLGTLDDHAALAAALLGGGPGGTGVSTGGMAVLIARHAVRWAVEHIKGKDERPLAKDVPATAGENSTGAGASPGETKTSDDIQPPSSPRIRFPERKAQRAHILREEEGHLPDTPENEGLLLDLANDREARRIIDQFGVAWMERMLPDGRQLWVSVRDGIVQDGGINQVPRALHPKTGLSRSAPRSSGP
ncbi:MAG: hypothetical protein KIS73_22695 [Enhydrobacter sp.]|nr:hypothetical protein [Enhydrobacter sp.]